MQYLFYFLLTIISKEMFQDFAILYLFSSFA